jgi:predicted RNA-binding protein
MRYWIGVASRDHVARGVAGGFCQLCHGKAQPLQRMSAGDWIIYYSPKDEFDGNTSCQRFTAIGEVDAGDVFAHPISHWFVPYRRNISFHAANEVDIHPLIAQLGFIRDKSRWGYAFRFGHLEISREDFELIAERMLVEAPAEAA